MTRPKGRAVPPYQSGLALFRRCRLRRVEFPDREFAPPQRAAFVAIHAGEFCARIGEDECEFLRALRFRLNGVAHVLRKRDAPPEECAGLGELPDPCMEALPRTKVRIGERPRNEVVACAPHAEEIDLRLRDSTRYAGKLTIDGVPLVPSSSVWLPGSERQILRAKSSISSDAIRSRSIDRDRP